MKTRDYFFQLTGPLRVWKFRVDTHYTSLMTSSALFCTNIAKQMMSLDTMLIKGELPSITSMALVTLRQGLVLNLSYIQSHIAGFLEFSLSHKFIKITSRDYFNQ